MSWLFNEPFSTKAQIFLFRAILAFFLMAALICLTMRWITLSDAKRDALTGLSPLDRIRQGLDGIWESFWKGVDGF
jgi:hypothetical protein